MNSSPCSPSFCFTFDTEPDDLWRCTEVSLENIRCLPEFHSHLMDVGARPTYLTTSEVAEDPEAATYMRAILGTGAAEIGAHFHTWTRTWPFDVPALGSPPLHAMSHQLDEPVERAMLEYTIEAIRTRLGITPYSYRGGRWSLGASTVRSLIATGIRVDTTVTPGVSWQQRGHTLLCGSDFRGWPSHPHWLNADFEQLAAPGVEGGVLELPVACGWMPPWSRALLNWSPTTVRGLRYILHNLHAQFPFGAVRMAPATTSLPSMLQLAELMIAGGSPCIVIAVHSSELISCRPLPTPEAVGAFKQRCIDLCSALVRKGCEGRTLLEMADALSG